MVLKYGPFNSPENAWDAYDFAEYLKLFFGNGVFPNPSSNLQVVTHQNMQTKVRPGVGFIEGHKIINTSDLILQHDVADGITKRIDRIVVRANFLLNKCEILIKKGANASSPVAPILVRNTDYYELVLADVLINNGATVITQANITDQRLNTNLCGVVATNITQLDTTTLALQYQSAFSQMTNEQRQNFEDWLATLRGVLAGDVAANLGQRILSAENSLTNHIAQKGMPLGYASLDANGRVPNTQLNISINDASTTQKGIVQLVNRTDSTSTIMAATGQAVKSVQDRANEAYNLAAQAFTQANDIKSKWATVIGAPLSSADTSTVLQTKTRTIRQQLAINLNDKGVEAGQAEPLQTLVNKVAQIPLGKKWSSGYLPWQMSVNTQPLQTITVNNLPFTPSVIVILNHLYFRYYTSSYQGGVWVPGSSRTIDTSYLHLHWNGMRFEARGGGSESPSFRQEVEQLQVTNNGFSFIYNVFSMATNSSIEGLNNCSVQWIAYE